MKLYHSPGSCSLSPHIALREAGIDVQLERVHLGTKQLQSGGDYRAINPKGSVPALQLEDGSVLTEGAAIVQYIADRKPESKLMPAHGSIERYRAIEWLNYVATEVHKQFSPLFNTKLTPETKQVWRDILAARFELLNKHLAERSYLMGEQFTVADGYLFTVLRWSKRVNIDMAPWPALVAYLDRVGNRPAVKTALEAEAPT